MHIEKIEIGTKITSGKYCVFFGNKNFHLKDFSKYFSNADPISLHQIHSDICIEAKPGFEQKADAHYSYEKNRALVIKTADCVPIMAYCKTTDTVLAIHAGWRGLQQNIIKKSLTKAFPYSKAKDLLVFVGPHIHKDNYEFSQSDIEKLTPVFTSNFYVQKNSLYYLDLENIYRGQLSQYGIETSNLHVLNEDTFSSPNLYSYRKSQTKGRLYHFIFRTA